MKKIYFFLIISIVSTLAAFSQTAPQICFTSGGNYSSYYSPEQDMAAIDWNHDGVGDYIVANRDSNQVYIHYGNPVNPRDFNSGTNPNIQPLFRCANPIQVEVANINLDAYPDIVIMQQTGTYDSIKVLISDGVGGYSSISHIEVSMYPYPNILAVDDINMDGADDILALQTNIYGPSSIFTYYNNGAGVFAANSSFTTDVPIQAVDFKDMDSDGDKDMFIGCSGYMSPTFSTDTSRVIILQNTTVVLNGTFFYSEAFRHTFTTGTELQLKDIAAGDIDGDLDVDFAVMLDQVTNIYLFMNDGVGGYNIVLSPDEAGGRTMSLADMDNDGDLDLVNTYGSGLIGHCYAQVNNGTGTFVNSNMFGSSSYYSFSQPADVDLDGIKDVLICSYNNGSGFIPASVCFNNGGASTFLTVSGGTTMCEGTNTTIVFHYSNPNLASDPITYYSWASGNDSLNYTADSSQTMYVTSTHGSCYFFDSIAVTVNPKPNVELGPDTFFCSNTYLIGVSPEAAVNYTLTTNPNYLYSNNSQEVITPIGDTATYFLNAQNSLTGCNAMDSVHVYIRPTPNVNLGSDINMCGDSVNIGTASESFVNYSWSSNPPGFSSTQNAQYVSPGVPTQYVITAERTPYNCIITDTINVTLHQKPALTGGGGVYSLCQGDSLAIGHILTPVGGTPPYTLNWWYGAGTVPDAGVNTMYHPTTAANFSVSIVDANGCTQGYTTSFSVPYTDSTNKDLVGHVTTPLPADVTNGLVYAFNHHPGSAGLDTADVVSLDANGKYVFTALDNDNYLIKVIPNAAAYPLGVPTYYGNTFQWDSSLVVTHGCMQRDTADIQIIELPTGPAATGTGFISGYVLEGPGFGTPVARLGPGLGTHPNVPFAPGGPLKGIDVKLGKNPGGGIQARIMTDSTGYYQFDSLPKQGYKIYVDIPNLPMDSTREVNLNIDSVSIQNNYYADSNNVYITDTTIFSVGIYSSEKVYENNFTIFPNPAKDELNIKFEAEKINDVSIEMSNAMGQNVYEERLKIYSSGIFIHTINASSLNLKAGVYFISVLNEGKSYTQRLIVME